METSEVVASTTTTDLSSHKLQTTSWLIALPPSCAVRQLNVNVVRFYLLIAVFGKWSQTHYFREFCFRSNAFLCYLLVSLQLQLSFWLDRLLSNMGVINQSINQSISLIADLRPEGRIANEMQVK